MKRDLSALVDREHDLLVVGGGVYGVAILWDAALRGLDAALVEREDFGSGTSFNNLKTVHGGIRYLQHGDLKRIRESVRERRRLMALAPHLVHPLPFLVPTYRGSLVKSRASMRVALKLNDLLSWDRNRLEDEDKHLPAGRVLSRDDCLELAPGLPREDLTGGVLWYDAQMHNPDRLTLSFVLSAAERGAVAVNHVEATGFLLEGSRVRGVSARDRAGGDDALEVRARVVVNAAGPWVDRLLAKIPDRGLRRPLFRFSKAVNLVTRPVVERVALGVTSRAGGRFFCIIPWRDVSLVGTSHASYQGEPDALEATEEDVQSLLDDVNAGYPEAKLARSDVRLVHRGLLPSLPVSPNGGVRLQKSYRIEDHRREGLEGLVSVVGVKYTTARDVAEKAVDRSLELLGREGGPSPSRETPLLGGDFSSLSELEREVEREGGLDAAAARHVARTYGTRYRAVLAAGRVKPLAPSTRVLDAEVRHAAREEAALDLSTVVLRRTELGTAGHPGSAALDTCASILAKELDWSEDRRRMELETVEAFYRARS